MPSWIVVANSERARIFEAEKRKGPLTEIKDLIEPLANQRNQDLVSDGPGSNSGGGSARHGVNGERDAKEQEAIRFAKRISEALVEGRNKSAYRRLYLIADPTMLGWLRNAMDNPTQALVEGEISKNLVAQKADEIRGHLPEYL